MSLIDETLSTQPGGCAVVDGYGITLSVAKGHLVVGDGIGRHRRERRYPKVGHGLDRLLVLGHTGSVSLEAVRRLTKTKVALVHLDADGTLLASTTHTGRDDARLRRQQALAPSTETGVKIARSLVAEKLSGQADVARQLLDAADVADRAEVLGDAVHAAPDAAEIVRLEAAAAIDYFDAWRGRVSVAWARNDMPRIPEHWSNFAGRRSPISATSSIRAADPINALLNYLYALAEAECRLACQAVGLDPGLGIIHTDQPGRDSLALDLIEVVRPTVDTWAIDLLDGHVFRKADFVELDDGHCRILPPLTHSLADTLTIWRQCVAPWAEHVAHVLADASPARIAKPTPLTSTQRRRAASRSVTEPVEHSSGAGQRPSRTITTIRRGCLDCGAPVTHRQRWYCPSCWPIHRQQAGTAGSTVAAAQLDEPAARAERGRAVSAGKKAAQARRIAEHGYPPDHYHSLIAPILASMSLRNIQSLTGTSQSTASRIRRGVTIADPSRWRAILLAAESEAADAS